MKDKCCNLVKILFIEIRCYCIGWVDPWSIRVNYDKDTSLLRIYPEKSGWGISGVVASRAISILAGSKRAAVRVSNLMSLQDIEDILNGDISIESVIVSNADRRKADPKSTGENISIAKESLIFLKLFVLSFWFELLDIEALPTPIDTIPVDIGDNL